MARLPLEADRSKALERFKQNEYNFLLVSSHAKAFGFESQV